MEIDQILHFLLPHLEPMKTTGITKKKKTLGKYNSKD